MPRDRIQELPSLPPRASEGHKGTYGTVLVIAGSRGMSGAAALVGASALRSGAGLVKIACPAEVQPIVASFEPSYMAWPLANDERGRLSFEANRDLLTELLATAHVVAVGPGLGQGGELPALVARLLEETDKPLVVDADALNALAAAGRVELLSKRPYPTVITPHPGELARLTGRSVADIQKDRPAAAASFLGDAARLVLVLKGAGTIVMDRARYYVNTTGNPGMATGGSGDCLTGVIAALLAQKLETFQAAQLGAFVHGLAGDIARDDAGEIGLIAGDIVDALPDAFLQLADHGTDEP